MDRIRVCALVLAVAFASAPSAAMADDTEAFRTTITEATKLAYEGKFDEAIVKYIEAKTLRDDPVIDYNIARCYHKKGDCQAAVAAYNGFVERSDADSADVGSAREYLDELGDCGVVETPVIADPGPGPDPDPDPILDPGPDPGTNDGAGWSYAAWGLTIGGGVLVASGIALDVAGASLVDDYEAAAAVGDQASYDQLRSDIETRQLTVYTLYGVGAAATVTGVVLLLLAPDEPGTAVAPTLMGDGAGVVFGGRF